MSCRTLVSGKDLSVIMRTEQNLSQKNETPGPTSCHRLSIESRRSFEDPIPLGRGRRVHRS